MKRRERTLKGAKQVTDYNLESQNLSYKQSQKGITLVALVVTIIVLLILAGVTIMTLFGENGLITMAQKAKSETENAQANAIAGMDSLIEQMGQALGEAPKAEKGKMIPVNKRYAVYSDSTGNAPIPGGFCVANDITKSDGTKDENKISTGLVISDVEGDDLNNSKGGNQFVWVPVPDVSKMYGVSSKDIATAKKYGKLYNFGTRDSSTGTITPLDAPTARNWKEVNGVMTLLRATGDREPATIGQPTGSYKCDYSEGNYTYARITDKEGKTITTADQFKALLEEEFNDMIESVKQYSGFYIGRYETGNLEENKTTIPVVQKGNEKIGSVNWYYMYANSKKIAKNSNVSSSMIWGCQWDATLTWMFNSTDPATRKFVIDSTGRGNYSWDRIPTGSVELFSVNHIYDMAGNICDLTMEAGGEIGRHARRWPFSDSGRPHFRGGLPSVLSGVEYSTRGRRDARHPRSITIAPLMECVEETVKREFQAKCVNSKY